MHGYGKVFWLIPQNFIDYINIFFLNGWNIISAFAIGFCLFAGTEFTPGGIIQLKVAASGIIEGTECFAVCVDKVFKKEIFVILIDFR